MDLVNPHQKIKVILIFTLDICLYKIHQIHILVNNLLSIGLASNSIDLDSKSWYLDTSVSHDLINNKEILLKSMPYRAQNL